MTIGVGLIGAGGMGSHHARNLVRLGGVRFVAVAEPDHERATRLATELGAELTFTDAEELIAHPAVDAVVVASPDETHPSLAMACIAAGKPVLCEKPLALSGADALAVVEAETRIGRRLVAVGFMREYDPAHADVAHIVSSGRLGQPMMFYGTHLNQGTGRIRALAEIVYQSIIHDLHSVRFLTGLDIEEVYLRSTDPPSLVTLSLGLSDGATGLLVMNTRAACYEVSVEVTATLGSIKMGDSAAASVRQDGREQRALSGDWFGRFTDAYQLEIEAWAGGLAVGVAVGPSAWDGYLATLAAEACMRSSETGTSIRVDPVARPAIYGPR